MAVLVNMKPESSKLEAALSRISLRFRGIETEVNKVNRSVSKINDVKIDTRASVSELRKLNQQITTTSKTLENTSKNIINSFKALAVTLTATFTGLGIIRAADNMTQLENRIALAVGRGKELNLVMSDLVDISNRTYSSLENSVSSFSKLQIAAKSLGATTEQSLVATENLQKALIISGSSAEAAAGAVMQLGQGLSSGVLRGDEFNSVMEGAPRIMKAIADEMGVATGQLRGLAEAGKITSDVIFNAMLNQGEAINQEFSNINPTISQLGAILSSTFSRTVATVDRTLGLTRSLGVAIKAVTSFISNNVRVIDSLAYAYATTLRIAVSNVILVLGGVFNVFAAIGKRAAAAIPTFITPMLTLFDVIDLAGSRAIGNLFVNVIDGLLGIRIAVMDLFDNQIAVAIRNLFQAKDAISIRRALDDLAIAFETVGLRWYNVINRITIVGRGLNIWLLRTGIFLGIIDQKLLRLRYASIERLGKAFEYISIVLLEVLLNVLTFTGIVDIFVAIEAAVKYAGRVIESFAPNLAEKLANERSQVNKYLYLLGVDLNAFGLKAGLAIGYIFVKAAMALQKLYLKPFVETKESLTIFVDSLSAFKDSIGSALITGMNKLSIMFGYLFSSIKEMLSPAKEAIEEFSSESQKSISSFLSAIVNNQLFETISNKIKVFADTLKRYLNDNNYFSSFINQLSNVKSSLTLIVNDLVDLGQSLKGKLHDAFSNIDNLFKEIYPVAKTTLEKTMKIVMDFVKKVEYGFFWLYDRVVGNSWWPDLIAKIATEAYKLHSEVLPEIELFVGVIDNLFRKLGKAVGLEINIKLPSLTGIVESVKNLIGNLASGIIGVIGDSFAELKEFSPELGNQVGLAIIAAMLTALSAAGISTWVGLVTFTTFVSAFDAAFKLAGDNILSSGIIQQVFESAGMEIGKLINKVVDNIPIIAEILLQGAGQFTSALLDQLGLVGTIIKGIVNFVPGGGILELLIFGGSIGIIFGKLDAVKSAINIFLSFITGTSFGGAGMNKRGTRPEGILGYILFGEGKVLLSLAAASLSILGVFDNLLNGIVSFQAVGASLGLLGFAILGKTGTVSVILTAIDKIAEGVFSLFGKTPKISLWDFVFDLYTSPNPSPIKKKFEEIMSSITQGNYGTKLTDAISNFSWADFATKIQAMTTFVKVRWASMILFMSNTWTGLLIKTSLVLGLIQAKFTAWMARLNTAALSMGPLGLVGKVLLGTVGVAIALAMFTTSANAATNEITDTIANVTSYLPMGLLGLFLLGTVANPQAALRVAIKTINFAFKTVLNLGKTLLIAAGATGFVGKAIITSVATSTITVALLKLSSLIIGWAVSLGLQLLVIIPAAFSNAFTAAGVSIGVLAGSIGFLLPAIAAVGAGLFFFGDNLTGWLGDLVFKITGIGTAAQKTKKELQDILTVDKVGQIDVVLRSKLDEINLSVLSERELATLKRELTTTNTILERNQSIFEQEGDLTRSQIDETNRALERANGTLERLAARGEASFAGGILKTIGASLNFEELRTGLATGLSDNMFTEQANQLINPVINRITEALNNPNATNEEVSKALVDLNSLLSRTDANGNPLFTPEEKSILFANVQNSETALRLLQDYNPIFTSLANGIPLTIDREQLSQLEIGAQSRFLANPNEEADYLLSRVNLALNANMGANNVELANLLATQLSDQLAARGLSNQVETSGFSSLFTDTREMTPVEMSYELGLDNLAMLRLIEGNEELLASTISINGVTRIGLDTLLQQVKAAEQLTSEREALNAEINRSLQMEAVGGPTLSLAAEDAARRKDIETRLAQLSSGASGLALNTFDFSKLTEIQAQVLERALQNYSEEVTRIERSVTSDLIQRLASEGRISQSDLAAFEESGGNISAELLDRIRSLGVQGFYTPELQAQMAEAGEKLTAIVTQTMTTSTEGLMESINNTLSSVGLNFELDFIDPEDYNLLMRYIDAIEERKRAFAASGSRIDFLGLKQAQLDATLLFADLEDKFKALAEFGVNLPSMDQVLALDQSTIDRILAAAKAIATLKMMIESIGARGAANTLNIPVGNIANAGEQVVAYMAAQQGIIDRIFTGPPSTPGIPADGGGGGDTETWWESFVSKTDALGLSLSEELLAGLSSDALQEMVRAGNEYKAAQDAINESAAHEVELRQRSVEQMRLAMLTAVDALGDQGTFSAIISQFEALGASLDASFIGTLNPALLDYANGIATQIKLLELQAQSMQAGSMELQVTTEAMNLLKLELDELQSSANVMSEAFQEGISQFLKGEMTFRDVFESLLDTFTNTIIEKFSKSFTESLFASLGLDNIFNSLFSNVFGFGSMAGSATANAVSSATGFATGGLISGPGTGTSDSILARLSNGEYVVNAATTKEWLPFLEAINSNDGAMPAFASGGLVGPSNPSAFKTMSKTDNKDKQQQVFNINVTGDVSMQTRKEVARMIPEITAGVNMTNRERGSR